LPGTKGLLATTVWPLEAKKSRKDLRMSATLIACDWVMANALGKINHALSPHALLAGSALPVGG
jgi:hypothetical protein